MDPDHPERASECDVVHVVDGGHPRSLAAYLTFHRAFTDPGRVTYR